MVPNVAEPLRPLLVPLASVHRNPANTRQHPLRNIEVIKASLARFGQRKPIVVQKEGMVVRAGNGMHQAAEELGWDSIAALVVDEAAVEAAAFEIVDNRSSEASCWNDPALAAQLQALRDSQVSIEGLGFDEDEFADLLARCKPQPPPEEFGEVDEHAETQYRCPMCGHEWNGQPR